MLPGAAARLPPHLHPTGAGRITARGSRPVRSRPATRTSKMCCLRSIFISVYHRTAESAARPSVTHRAARSAAHSVTARGVDCTGCAASGPSSHPSLIGPRGRQPTMSLHEVSTVQVCCLLPIFLSVSHRAAGSAAYSVTARGVDCAGVLPPARSPFQRSPGGGVGPPRVSLHEVSTVQVVLPPARLPIRLSPRRGVGQPTVSWHEVATV